MKFEDDIAGKNPVGRPEKANVVVFMANIGGKTPDGWREGGEVVIEVEFEEVIVGAKPDGTSEEAELPNPVAAV